MALSVRPFKRCARGLRKDDYLNHNQNRNWMTNHYHVNSSTVRLIVRAPTAGRLLWEGYGSLYACKAWASRHSLRGMIEHRRQLSRSQLEKSDSTSTTIRRSYSVPSDAASSFKEGVSTADQVDSASYLMSSQTSNDSMNMNPTALSKDFFNSLIPPESSSSPWLSSLNGGYTRLLDVWNYNYPWDPVLYSVEGTFELLQATTHLPWWVSILAFAAAARIILFPLAVKQARFSGIMESIQPELEALKKKSIYQVPQKTPDGKRDWSSTIRLQQEMTQVMKDHNVSPFGAMKYSLPQAFSLILVFVSLNRIARESSHELHHVLKTGGDLWFNDLTLSDPYFILPTLSMLSTTGLILSTPTPGRSKTFLTWMLVIISGTTLLFTYSFPIAVHLFWIGSNTVSMLTALLLRTNYMRTLFNLPLNSAHQCQEVKVYDFPPPSVTKNAAQHASLSQEQVQKPKRKQA